MTHRKQFLLVTNKKQLIAAMNFAKGYPHGTCIRLRTKSGSITKFNINPFIYGVEDHIKITNKIIRRITRTRRCYLE